MTVPAIPSRSLGPQSNLQYFESTYLLRDLGRGLFNIQTSTVEPEQGRQIIRPALEHPSFALFRNHKSLAAQLRHIDAFVRGDLHPKIEEDLRRVFGRYHILIHDFLKDLKSQNRVNCPSCDGLNERNNSFCGCCGYLMVERVEEIIDEKREATMVFTDLKGFSVYSEKTEAAQLFRDVREIHQLQDDAALAYGLYHSGRWGDANLYVSGVPKYRDNHADMAMQASLTLLENMRSWNSKRRALGLEELVPRIGINSGKVAWGRGGNARHDRGTVFGNQVNIGARAEPVARPGCIAATLATIDQLSSGYETRPLGEVQVKNIKEPIQFFEVSRAKSKRRVTDARGKEQVKLIGRETQLQSILDSCQNAYSSSRANLLLVSAEAGHGKTRLKNEVIKAVEAKHDNVIFLEVQGDPLQVETPFRAFANAIRNYADIRPGDAVEASRPKLKNIITTHFDDPPEEIELLLSNFVGLQIQDPPSWFKNAQELKDRTLGAIRALFERISEKGFLFLILEDLHSQDPASLKYSEFVLEGLKNRPVFALGLSRPQFNDSNPSLVADNRSYIVSKINLSKLTQSECEQMIIEILGAERSHQSANPRKEEKSDEKVSVIELLPVLSDRNPYILQEMALALRDGCLMGKDALGKWEFIFPAGSKTTHDDADQTSNNKMSEAERLARRFLWSRIDSLSEPSDKEFLWKASVFGPEFSLDDLKGMGIENPARVSLRLMRRQFLADLSDAGKPGRFQFAHALLQDAAYSMITKDRRAATHKMITEYLRERNVADPALLAYHFEMWSNNEEGKNRIEKERKRYAQENAATYYRLAAEEAYGQGAFRTAAGIFEKSHNLAELAEAKARLRFLILKGWDQACLDSKMYEENERLFQESITVAQGSGDFTGVDIAGTYLRLGRSLNRRKQFDRACDQLVRGYRTISAITRQNSTIDAQKLRISLLIELGYAYSNLADDQKRALAFYERAAERARVIKDKRLEGFALMGVNQMVARTGDYATKFIVTQRAAAIALEDNNKKGALTAMIGAASTLLAVGAYEEAKDTLKKAKDIADQWRGNVPSIEALNANRGLLAYYLNDHHSAVQIFEATLARENVEPLFVPILSVCLALAQLEVGQETKAEKLAKVIIRKAEETDHKGDSTIGHFALAKALLVKGNVSEALYSAKIAYDLRKKAVPDFYFAIILTYVQALIKDNRLNEALNILEEAKSELENRAKKITDEKYQKSILESVEVHRKIIELRDVLRIREVESRDLSDDAKKELEANDVYIPKQLPLKFQYLTGILDRELRESSYEDVIDNKIINFNSAGVILPISLGKLFGFLENAKIKVKENPAGNLDIGPITLPLGDILSAREIEAEFFRSSTGKRCGVLDFDIFLGSRNVAKMMKNQKKWRELVEDTISSEEGILTISFTASESSAIAKQNGVVSVDGQLRPSTLPKDILNLFGDIRLSLAMVDDTRTLLIVDLEDTPFTQHPRRFIIAIAESLFQSYSGNIDLDRTVEALRKVHNTAISI